MRAGKQMLLIGAHFLLRAQDLSWELDKLSEIN